MDVLVRYHGGWGLGDLLCSDPMMLGLVERFGPQTRIWTEGRAGNVAHNPLVRGPAPAGLVPDHVVDVRLFTHMPHEEYGRLEALPSLVDHMCSYAEVTPSDRRPRLHLSLAERRAGLQTIRRLAGGARPRVAICADHLDPLRHWPVERWHAVARALADAGATVLEFGVQDRLGVGVDLVGRLDVREAAGLLEHCDLYLGNNSGLFHYAQAAGCPCVVLFSLATPARFVHPGATVHAVQADELPCIDCMTRRFAAMQRLGCVAAPRGRCVTDVTVERMLTAVEAALRGEPSRVLAPAPAIAPAPDQGKDPITLPKLHV